MSKAASLLLGAAVGAVALLIAQRASADCPSDPATELATKCPCAGKGGEPWRNHGQYVSCVVRFRNDLRRAGCLTAETQRTIARCAARSTCGKEDAVLCCFVESTGSCTAGTCSNVARSCTADTDCTVVTEHPKLARNAPSCADRGGYSAGTGSLCSTCPPPPTS